MERLQKVIANRGYSSRRKAEALIKEGKVKVNNEVVKELGYKVKYNDLIEINGKVLESQDKIYILLNKPRGVVCTTSDEKKRKTVLDLIECDKRIYPVGRLDYDTTGALILTNDGDLTNILTHPKNLIDKVYIAKINGFFDKKSQEIMKKGIKIDDYKTSASKVKLKKYDKKTNTSLVELIIHEGKNHQVKNMFKALNFDVIKLKREKIDFLDVKSLKSGEYRYLSIKEVKKLYNKKN